jgi:hypothetical protein
VWLLGAAKLVVGLSRGKPVGILIVGLVVLAVVWFMFQKLPRRTRAGDRVLKEIQNKYHNQRGTEFGSEKTAPISELVLAAGLFGMTAVDHPEVAKLHAAIQSVPASSGGEGCGGGGCGGGCGGCGGCGG